jgi:hypothetical protein
MLGIGPGRFQATAEEALRALNRYSGCDLPASNTVRQRAEVAWSRISRKFALRGRS